MDSADDNQREMASCLAAVLRDEDIEISDLDILDSLGYLGLKLTRDHHGDAGIAYVSAIQDIVNESDRA